MSARRRAFRERLNRAARSPSGPSKEAVSDPEALDLGKFVSLRDTRFGAAWVFDCPGCEVKLAQFYRATCLNAARRHIVKCPGPSPA